MFLTFSRWLFKNCIDPIYKIQKLLIILSQHFIKNTTQFFDLWPVNWMCLCDQHHNHCRLTVCAHRYPGMLVLLTLLMTSQRDTLIWRAPRLVMPTPRRSLRYQYPRLPHIATQRAGSQAEGWVFYCFCCHSLFYFVYVSVLFVLTRNSGLGDWI